MSDVREFCESLCAGGWDRHTLAKLNLALEARSPLMCTQGMTLPQNGDEYPLWRYEWPTERHRRDYMLLVACACDYLRSVDPRLSGFATFINTVAVDVEIADLKAHDPDFFGFVVNNLAFVNLDWENVRGRECRTNVHASPRLLFRMFDDIVAVQKRRAL